ncbi:hypothetical protein EC988_005807, partial [Linderina pennispora]
MLMARGWQAKLVLLRRVAWMMGVLYFLRSITISLTTMPPSIKGCVPVLPKDTNELLAHIPGSFTGEVGACTDKIFSGHTTILVISFLFWTRYARHWAFIAYSAIHTIAGILSVLAVRYHYSIDVLLAIILTYFVHHAYYGALDRAILLRDMLAGRQSYSMHSALPVTGPAKRTSEYVYGRVQEGSEDDIEELFEQSPADAPTMVMSDSEKPQMRTSSYVSVPMPVAADEECLEKGYYVPSDRNASSVDSMVVNRPMSRTLPKGGKENMGLFSFLKKKDEDFEKILGGLEQDLKRTEKQRQQSLDRTSGWSQFWLTYTSMAWIGYLLGFILYVYPERHDSQALNFPQHCLAVLLGPFIIYYGNYAIRM